MGNKRWNLARNNCKFRVRFTCFDKSIQNAECGQWYHKFELFPVGEKSWYPHRLSKPLETKHGMYTSRHSNSNPKFLYQKQCLFYIVINKAIMSCFPQGFWMTFTNFKTLEKYKSWIICWLTWVPLGFQCIIQLKIFHHLGVKRKPRWVKEI